MQNNNLYINDFVDTLCRNRYDIEGNDVAKEKLFDLQKCVTSREFDEASRFYYKVNNFYRLATEEDVDIEDQKTVEKAQEYEDFVDNVKIYPENKAALYDTLLGFIEINGGGKFWYLKVLRKKAENIEKNHDIELNIAAKQAFFHKSAGEIRPIYLNIMHQLYSKMQDKTKFLFLNELGLVKDEKSKKIVALSKLTPQQRLNRLSVIEAIVKQPLPIEARIALLEEGLKLANKNLRNRSENFEIKSKFCKKLQEDYTTIGDFKKANEYGLASYNWNKSAGFAIEYGHNLRQRT